MPIYEYRCEDCEQIFEEWQKDFKEQDVPCPVCGAQSRRLISNTSFILKGTGWYVTDYCKSGTSTNASGADNDGAAKGDAGNGNGNGNGDKKAATATADAGGSASKPAAPAAPAKTATATAE